MDANSEMDQVFEADRLELGSRVAIKFESQTIVLRKLVAALRDMRYHDAEAARLLAKVDQLEAHVRELKGLDR